MKQKVKTWLYGCLILLGSMAIKTSIAQTTCTNNSNSCNYIANSSFESHTSNYGIIDYDPITGMPIYGCDALRFSSITGATYPFTACIWDDNNNLNGGTPDYYNACGSTTIYGSTNAYNSYSSNGIGSMAPHSGDGYAGFYVAQTSFGTSFYEYVRQTITTPLIAGKTYQVGMWLRLAHMSRYAATFDVIIAGNSVTFTTSPITNKNNWTYVSTCFTPTYIFDDKILIGGPPTSALTDLNPGSWSIGIAPSFSPGDHENSAYYYVDDVSITPLNVNAGSDITLYPGCSSTIGSTIPNNFPCYTTTGITATYNWVPNTNLSANNTATTIASPSVTTTYTVYTTVTYTNPAGGVSTCSSSDEVTVFVTSPTISITPSYTCNFNGVSSFTANVTPSGSYTYSWTVKDAATGTVVPVAGTGTTGATPSFSLLNVTRPVNVCVSVINNLGCISTPTCYYLPNCCPTSTNVVKYANTTYTGAVIPSGTALAFGGTITVNSGGQLIIIGKDVQLEPNTKFVLNGTGKLVFTNDYVHGCGAMWDGIYANTTSTIQMTTSRIEDAKRVIIDSLGTASIVLNGNYFNKNNVGIAFKAAKTSTSGVVIKNTFFSCVSTPTTGTVPYIPTVPNLTNAATLGAMTSTVMLPPYNTQKSFCGIYMINASHTGKSNSAITIGGATNEENVFDKMQYGAYVSTSSSVFQNNVFQNIKNSIAPAGSGNYNTGVYVFGQFGGGGSYYTRVGGTSTAYKNTFTNNDYGLLNVWGTGLNAEYNRFDTQTNGINIYSNNGHNTAQISHNKFVNNTIAINFNQNNDIFANVEENWIENTSAIATTADNFAIRCTEAVTITDPNNYPKYFINNNYMSGYYNGVYLSHTSKASVQDNEVHMRPDASCTNIQNGIAAVNTSETSITNNTIDMPSGTPNSWCHAGIFMNTNTNPEIRCNSISYIDHSMGFNDLNLTVPGYGIYSNTMSNGKWGIWLNANGEIGDQYYNTTTYSADNKWSNFNNETYVSLGSNNFGGTGAKFYTRNVAPYNITNPAGAGNILSGINATGGFAGACSSSSTPTLNLRTNGAGKNLPLMQYAQQIADGTMSFSQNEESAKQIARCQLYRLLALNQIDLNVKDDFSTFMNTQRSQAIGRFFVIDSLINTNNSSNLQKALAQNNAVNAITDVEQTQQQLNGLYINYLNNNRHLTDADIKAMENIATLCPMVYGTSVHQARSILFNITYKQYVNTCEFSDTKQQQARMASTAIATSSLVKLYPNPSNGSMVLETGNDLNYNLVVYNILGEKMYDAAVSDKQSIDLSTLPSATYIVLIKQNDTIIKTEHISIIH